MRSKGMNRPVLTASTVCVSITLVLVGMSAGTPQAVGPCEFVVVDNTGKQVGILLDHPHHWASSGDEYTVVIPHQGDWLALDVERDHFQTNSNILYYKVANCQGTAFQAKLPAPESDRFVGDGDPSLRQEVFAVPQVRAGGGIDEGGRD